MSCVSLFCLFYINCIFFLVSLFEGLGLLLLLLLLLFFLFNNFLYLFFFGGGSLVETYFALVVNLGVYNEM